MLTHLTDILSTLLTELSEKNVTGHQNFNPSNLELRICLFVFNSWLTNFSNNIRFGFYSVYFYYFEENFEHTLWRSTKFINWCLNLAAFAGKGDFKGLLLLSQL